MSVRPVFTASGPSPIPSICVSDVMSAPPVVCDPTADLCHIAGRMARRRIHSVVVTDHDGLGDIAHARAVISELDLVRAVAKTGVGVTAARIAAGPVVTIAADASLTEAAHAMIGADVAHLVVLDGRRPVGVLSSFDIAATIAATPVPAPAANGGAGPRPQG